MTTRKQLAKGLSAVILGLLAITAIFPFVYMVLTSLRQTYTMDLNIKFSELNLKNYYTIFNNYDFARYFMNSLVVVTFACLFNCLISSLAAFGFAKKRFWGRDAIFAVYLATLMIPSQVVLVPTFILMQKLHLMNTYAALFLPIVNAFGVFLIRQFMVNVPDELLEAASIDGCPEWKAFFVIVIPLVKPVLISLTIFTFISAWNDFIWPLIAITDGQMSTLTLALSSLQGNYSTNYGLVMAGAALTFFPPFILYLFLQKQFVEGIALSGIKG